MKCKGSGVQCKGRGVQCKGRGAQGYYKTCLDIKEVWNDRPEYFEVATTRGFQCRNIFSVSVLSGQYDDILYFIISYNIVKELLAYTQNTLNILTNV